jgi:predicted outer membrane repeat protein
MTMRFSLLAMLWTMMIFAPQAGAALLVDRADSGCSDTAGTPYCSIQAAVDAAASGDSIEVAAGTYTDQHFSPYVVTITKALTLLGAGVDQTVIDGETVFGGIAIAGSINVHISGFTIKRGKAPNTGGVSNGGGIKNWGVLTVTNCAIRDSVATDSGGAIFSSLGVGTSLTVENCLFENNQAKGDGSLANRGIYTYGGGAIYAIGALTVAESTFNTNSAVEAGGAIFLFKTNFASSAQITSSSFSGNKVTYAGGAIATQGDLKVLSSNLTQNVATLGGAIHAEGHGTVVIGTSTFSSNSAGALDNEYAVTTVFSSTFYQMDNMAAIVNGTSAQLNIKNTIVTHSAGAPSTSGDCRGTFISQGYNLITDATNCTFNATAGDLVGSSASPMPAKLDKLADNGGPTKTHAPFSDSPTIDAGNPAGCSDASGAALSVDQRGQARSSDDNNDGVVRCNIGAYEGALAVSSGSASSPPSGAPTSGSGTSSGGGGSFDFTLMLLIVLMRRRCAPVPVTSQATIAAEPCG